MALVDRLTTEKLRAEAEAIVREGWRWVDAAFDFAYGHTNGLRRLRGEAAPLDDEEQAQRNALQAEYDQLVAEHEEADELPEAVDARLGELEELLESFETRPVHYDPAEIARAGAFVSIGHDGRLQVESGFVRPEDEVSTDSETGEGADGREGEDGRAAPGINGSGGGRTGVTMAGETSDAEDEEDAVKPLPERLVLELTAHRTLALREAVARNPEVALTLLLHKLVGETFRHGGAGHCLEASVRHVFFAAQAPDLKDSPPAKGLQQMREAWQQDLPTDDQGLWDWLTGLDGASRLALLAHCVAYGVNAVQERVDRYGGGASAHQLSERIRQADRLARAVALDMVDAGWRPTVANYLGRVTKPCILAAVREGAGEAKAALIDHLKKAEMAQEAERLLADTDWLPEPLRSPGDSGSTEAVGDEAAGDAGLPAFLTGEDDDGELGEGDDDAEDSVSEFADEDAVGAASQPMAAE